MMTSVKSMDVIRFATLICLLNQYENHAVKCPIMSFDDATVSIDVMKSSNGGHSVVIF